jgi:hypothetical protein
MLAFGKIALDASRTNTTIGKKRTSVEGEEPSKQQILICLQTHWQTYELRLWKEGCPKYKDRADIVKSRGTGTNMTIYDGDTLATIHNECILFDLEFLEKADDKDIDVVEEQVPILERKCSNEC